MFDAIILSDVHLGADICQAKLLDKFLKRVVDGEVETKSLIINGDLFEDANFGRLKKHHWKVLSLIRKMSKNIECIFLRGNHDLPTDLMSLLLGVKVVDEYILESGDKKILCLHGDRFDDFLTDHPVLTWIGDIIYTFLQKIDKSHYFAKLAKHSSKHYLRCGEVVKERAIKYVHKKKCDMVCVGHIHLASTSEFYYNSGSWTELPCHYLTVDAGKIELHEFKEQ